MPGLEGELWRVAAAHPKLVRALVKTNSLSIALESRYTRRTISPLDEEDYLSHCYRSNVVSHEIRGVLAREREREKRGERQTEKGREGRQEQPIGPVYREELTGQAGLFDTRPRHRSFPSPLGQIRVRSLLGSHRPSSGRLGSTRGNLDELLRAGRGRTWKERRDVSFVQSVSGEIVNILGRRL